MVTPPGFDGSKQTSITRRLPLTPSLSFQFPFLFQAFIFFSSPIFCLFFFFFFFISGGQEQSPALIGAPRRIALNSWGAERGRRASPAWHYLPFTSLLAPPHLPRWNSGSQAFISPLPDGAVFCSPPPPSSRHLSRRLPGLLAERLHSGDRP